MKSSVLLAATGLLLSTSVCAQEKPNIIWLMAEDMSLDLECYGMKGVKTPNLNKMADQGVLFTNCFCTNSICSPSRSAMMTGVHQVKINAHNHRSNRDVPLAKPYKPFTYWLRKGGYTCVLGHHGVMGKGRKTDVNFKSKAIGPWDGENNFGLFDKVDHFEVKDQPFFAQIQLKVTHRGDWWNQVRAQSEHPVNPDSIALPPYLADHPTIRLDWAKYLDQVEYMDSEVGMILQELEDKGMADNTLVIFIGDNGRCNVFGKGYLHDAGLHIPLIVKWPKGFKDRAKREEVVSTTDITATILDIAGVHSPEYLTGKSFLQKNFNREEVYSARDLWDEIKEKSRALTSGRWKYIRNDMPQVSYDAHQTYLEFYRPAVHVMRSLKEDGLLNSNQQLFFMDHKPVEELYDLQDDPFELNNLAEVPEFDSLLKAMRSKTLMYDRKMSPVSNVFHPVNPISVEVFEWVKKEKPELYKQMVNGTEIGFGKLVKEYKRLNRQ